MKFRVAYIMGYKRAVIEESFYKPHLGKSSLRILSDHSSLARLGRHEVLSGSKLWYASNFNCWAETSMTEVTS